MVEQIGPKTRIQLKGDLLVFSGETTNNQPVTVVANEAAGKMMIIGASSFLKIPEKEVIGKLRAGETVEF